MTRYFDFHKWQFKMGRTAKEINSILDEYGVKNKKIVKVSAIGIAENLEEWRYRREAVLAAYNSGVPRDTIINGDYPYMDNILLPCRVRICEPFILIFDDGTTLELMPVDGDSLMIGYNSIPAELTDGVNERNFDPNALFYRIFCNKISDISIQTRITTSESGTYEFVNERSNKTFQFRLSGQWGFMIRQSWDGWFDVILTDQNYAADLGNEAATITYGELKKAAFNNDQIVIVAGHDSSSYFWIMPVKLNDDVSLRLPDRVDEFRDEEISIEEDDVNTYLYYFLNKYFDENISYDGYRDEYCGNGLEWNLEYNLYAVDAIRDMLSEIERVSKLLAEKNDSKELDAFKSTPRYKFVADDIAKAVSFYDRFIFRMNTMIENWPEGYEYVSFMGP